MLDFLIRVVFSETGTTALEYGILAALIGGFMFWSYQPVGDGISIIYTDLASTLKDSMRLPG